MVLVSGEAMPVPDTESPHITAALEQLGLTAEVWIWTQPAPWEVVPLVVCRSTWDYFHRAEEFLDWVDAVAARTRLENPAPLLRWNAHKSYLLELSAAGVPIVPTVLVARAAADSERAAALGKAAEVVVKPAIGGGALGARRGLAADPAMAEHLRTLTVSGDALVQPLIASVPSRGEVSLIYFGGRFSHAVRKVPAAGDFRVQPQHGGAVTPEDPTPAEVAVAETTLRSLPGRALYARFDLVEGEDGPLLMEAELIEPFLFLSSAPGAAERLARVLADVG